MTESRIGRTTPRSYPASGGGPNFPAAAFRARIALASEPPCPYEMPVSLDTERKIPAGRLGRLARLAAAGVRSGAGMVVGRDGSSSARAAAEVLGTLRGL